MAKFGSILGVFVSAFLGVSSGATIIDTFGNPGSLYSTSVGTVIAGSDFAFGEIDQAAGFIPGTNSVLTKIDLGVSWIGGTDAATVSLHDDNSGSIGALLVS